MKDPSELYLLDPDSFVPAMKAALDVARRWSDADRPTMGSDRHTKRQTRSAHTPSSSGAARNLRFHTAREVGEETPESPVWHVEGYLAAGAITELSGKIKAAGKTTFLTLMARAISVGDPFLGRTTTQTRVVYLTEQPSASFREALRRAGLLDSDDVLILYWRETVGIGWPEVVQRAAEECQQQDANVLIVDTLPKFARLRGDAENNAGDADEAMEPLQIAANDGVAVAVARHERKAGGEVGDSGRGSTAFGGAVDIVLSLKRPQGESRVGVRELSALSRFDETPDLLVIELTDDGYVAHGDERSVVLADARRDAHEALPHAPEAAVTIDDLVARANGASRATVQRALDALLGDGVATRVGKGRRGDPYRYHRRDPGLDGAIPAAHIESGSGQNETASHAHVGEMNALEPDDQVHSLESPGWRCFVGPGHQPALRLDRSVYCGTCHPATVGRSDGREATLEWPG
jgi:hypothetical protein